MVADELSWAGLGCPMAVATAIIRAVKESGLLSPHAHTPHRVHICIHACTGFFLPGI